MKQSGKLFFFCGKMAAGKSTLAREIARREDAVLIVQVRSLPLAVGWVESTKPNNYIVCGRVCTSVRHLSIQCRCCELNAFVSDVLASLLNLCG